MEAKGGERQHSRGIYISDGDNCYGETLSRLKREIGKLGGESTLFSFYMQGQGRLHSHLSRNVDRRDSQ